jgi:hypothetical protein
MTARTRTAEEPDRTHAWALVPAGVGTVTAPALPVLVAAVAVALTAAGAMQLVMTVSTCYSTTREVPALEEKGSRRQQHRAAGQHH